jgi:hypothetical protein
MGIPHACVRRVRTAEGVPTRSGPCPPVVALGPAACDEAAAGLLVFLNENPFCTQSRNGCAHQKSTETELKRDRVRKRSVFYARKIYHPRWRTVFGAELCRVDYGVCVLRECVLRECVMRGSSCAHQSPINPTAY